MIKLTSAQFEKYYKIVSLNLDNDLCDYFKSVGVGVYDSIELIRKAPFYGPIHVRNILGAEFIIDYKTAENIFIDI